MKFKTMMLAAGALTACAEVPVVSNVTISQDAMTRIVTVGYTLSAPGIVTFDILTNGVSIGMSNVRTVSGDMNKLVAAGDHQAFWRPSRDWPGMKFSDAIVSAEVTAWDRTTPPDYCAVDLQCKALSFYTCEDALPGGISDERYRRGKLLMRRVPAGGATFMMGDRPADVSQCPSYGYTGAREVSLTNDFYIGVFEFTQAQLKLIANSWNPSKYQGDLNPVDSIAYETVRGHKDEADWPSTGNVVGSRDPSVCWIMRNLTGSEGWDLPTSAQWEFAARAGTTTSYSNGQDMKPAGSTHDEADDIAWSKRTVADKGLTGTQPVGTKNANAWGLYDMSGNVWEWVRDWCRADNEPGVLLSQTVEPAGELSGKNRLIRGGFSDADYTLLRAASQYNGMQPTGVSYDLGFRLICPAHQMFPMLNP